MNKNSVLILLASIILCYSCKKDNDENIENHSFNSTLFSSSIPRVDINSGKLTAFLSFTNDIGIPIKGLTKANFEVYYEIDGTKYTVNNSTFNLLQSTGNGSSYNVLAALPLDYSSSMTWDSTTIPKMQNAVKTFISLKSANDYIKIIKFSTDVYNSPPFSNDTNQLYYGINNNYLIYNYATALNQACLTGLNELQNFLPLLNSTYLPVLIAFTDGVNNCYPYTNDTVISKAIYNQIPVYTICYGNINSGYPDTTLLKHLADTTGGRYYLTPDVTQLQDLYSYVSGQLGNMYVITFPFGFKTNKSCTLYITVNYVINGTKYINKTKKSFWIK